MKAKSTLTFSLHWNERLFPEDTTLLTSRSYGQKKAKIFFLQDLLNVLWK